MLSLADDSAKRLLQSVLLHYLRSVTPQYLPGVDGQTVDDVLSQYSELAARGVVPDRGRLAQQNPDLRPELDSFFAADRGVGTP